MNEIEIFDGRRLCSDKLSSDLLPSRFICCTLLHFADHFVFCTCWNPHSPAAKVHTYSMPSSFLESSKQAHCSWAGDATVKVATYSSKNSWVNQNRRGSVISASASFRYKHSVNVISTSHCPHSEENQTHSTMKNKIWVQLSIRVITSSTSVVRSLEHYVTSF